MSSRGPFLWPESYVLKLTHKHFCGKKKKAKIFNPTKLRRKLSTYLSSCKVERMAWQFIYFSQASRGEKELADLQWKIPNSVGKARSNPQTESVYRVPELYRVLHSLTRTCWWCCNHTRPSAKRGRRRCWKNSTDRQIKRQKNAVSFFWGALSLDCLSMHVCPQIQHACKQTDL
jgi:hypothetical protein